MLSPPSAWYHISTCIVHVPEPIFNNQCSVGPRDWGEEIMLTHVTGSYTFKKLFIKKGCKGGLQYHRFKDESGYLVSGKLILRYADTANKLQERVLVPGDSFHFPPFTIHQEEALEDCVILEASNPVFNDRVRCELDFNISDQGEGLPSSEESEIIFK